MLGDNGEFEEAFDTRFKSVFQKELTLRNLSTRKRTAYGNRNGSVRKNTLQTKEQSDDKHKLSGYGQTKIGKELFPAFNYPEVMKRGFGMRQHKHNEELEAQAQLNSMPRVAFQVKKKDDLQ